MEAEIRGSLVFECSNVQGVRVETPHIDDANGAIHVLGLLFGELCHGHRVESSLLERSAQLSHFLSPLFLQASTGEIDMF